MSVFITIATDKRGYPHGIFLISWQTYVVGTHLKHLTKVPVSWWKQVVTHLKHLNEVLQVSTHNIIKF